MAINKVQFGGSTLIDLSTDTVATANDIAQGKVGHLNDGTVVTGTHSGGETLYVTHNGRLYTKDTVIDNGNRQYVALRDDYAWATELRSFDLTATSIGGDQWAMFQKNNGHSVERVRLCVSGSLGRTYMFTGVSNTLELGGIGKPITAINDNVGITAWLPHFIVYVDATTLSDIPSSILANAPAYGESIYKNSTTGEVITG